MGDDAAFFDDKGVADPALVTLLQTLKEPPLRHANLLARFIDHYAGDDLRFQAQGQSARVIDVRSRVLDLMREMQILAVELEALETDQNADLLELALNDILAGHPLGADHRLATRAADAVQLIATLPLTRGLPRGRPAVDPVVTNVVRAVRAYCEHEGIAFAGDPRTERVYGVSQPLATSEAAQLAESVLRLVGLTVTPQQLATHFRKARES